jgi:hypothetical protein
METEIGGIEERRWNIEEKKEEGNEGETNSHAG